MARYVKIASQLPEELHQRYFALDHGQKQLACAAGFLLYFACDEETQWAYREWARAIAEGRATTQEPPPGLKTVLPTLTSRSKTRRKRYQ